MNLGAVPPLETRLKLANIVLYGSASLAEAHITDAGVATLQRRFPKRRVNFIFFPETWLHRPCFVNLLDLRPMLVVYGPKHGTQMPILHGLREKFHCPVVRVLDGKIVTVLTKQGKYVPASAGP